MRKQLHSRPLFSMVLATVEGIFLSTAIFLSAFPVVKDIIKKTLPAGLDMMANDLFVLASSAWFGDYDYLILNSDSCFFFRDMKII